MSGIDELMSKFEPGAEGFTFDEAWLVAGAFPAMLKVALAALRVCAQAHDGSVCHHAQVAIAEIDAIAEGLT